MDTEIRVKRVASAKELAKAFAIRMRVFVKEQGVPREIELDRDDGRAIHFVAFAGRRAIGTARVVWHHGSAKIGRMAVLKSYRGRGVGKKLLKRAIETARKSEVRERKSEAGGQRSVVREETAAAKRRKPEIKHNQSKEPRARTIYLHAQVSVIGFYESMGFHSVGPIFDEAGIAHRKMILAPRLSSKPIKPPIRRQASAE
jgi:predicted GNAT family N-acyltransferase